MRIIFLIPLLFLITSCEAQLTPAQSAIFYKPFRDRAPLGNLLQEDFTAGSLPSTSSPQNYSFSSYGSPTLAFPGTGMTISGGAGDFSKGVKWDMYNCFENFSISMDFVLNVAGFGIGAGIQNDITPNGCRAVHARYVSTGGSSGRVLLEVGNGGLSLGGGSFSSRAQTAVVTATLTHSYRVTLSRVSTTVTTYTATIQDLTLAGAVQSAVFVESLTYPQTYLANSTGRFNIVTPGGEHLVTDWQVSTTDISGAQDLFVGNSITHGLYATDLSTRFAQNVSLDYWISGGPGDITQYVVDKLPSIQLLNPQRVFLMIGGNDVLFGVAQATYEANYTTIRNTLVGYGFQVVHLLATPRDGPDMTTLNTFISTTFSGNDLVIDTFTPLEDGGAATELAAAYDSGDGTHPNQAGHDLIASTIAAAL